MFKLCCIALLCGQFVCAASDNAGFKIDLSEGSEFLKPEGVYTEYEEGEEEKEASKSRPPRFLPYIQLPLIDMLKQSAAHNYVPFNFGDPFDFLRHHYPQPSGHALKEYDFVIVGGGTAGSVLASRLSEHGKWSVLLLEAGGAELILSEVPLLAPYFQSTDFNWGFRAEKHDGQCRGMDEHRCPWPRGKGIGGSSIINYMIYTRGHRIDWDRIAQAGNPGWSYEEVLPYFLKSERANLKGVDKSKYHNKHGLLSVEYAPYRTPLSAAFFKAAKEHGHEKVDYNEGNKLGFSYVQANIHNGKRQSTARAFLYPVRNRKNLHILPYSRVIKINIGKKSRTAKSVEYVRNKLKFKVKARKEIILSAGALSTPQLLMLSGIGPKRVLSELGINVIQDLSVGENLHDHLTYPGLVFLSNSTGHSIIESSVLNLKNFASWLHHSKGPFTVPAGVEGIGFIKSNVSEEAVKYPDIELLFVPGGLTAGSSNVIRKAARISDSFYHDAYGKIIEKECFSIFPVVLHPKSRGFIKLKSKNPFHWPEFHHYYFNDRHDLHTLVEGIKYAVKMSKTKAFKKFGAKLYKKPFPVCNVYPFGSDDYWECAARTLGMSIYEQAGTCKMGPPTDPHAVVDNLLKVYGIDRLRVADASVIPIPLSGHTNTPVVMIAEKLADILKRTWS